MKFVVEMSLQLSRGTAQNLVECCALVCTAYPTSTSTLPKLKARRTSTTDTRQTVLIESGLHTMVMLCTASSVESELRTNDSSPPVAKLCLVPRYSCSNPECPKIRESIMKWEEANNPPTDGWTSELVLKHRLQSTFSTWTQEYLETLPVAVQQKYHLSVFDQGAVMPSLAESLLHTDDTWSDFSRVVDAAYSQRNATINTEQYYNFIAVQKERDRVRKQHARAQGRTTTTQSLLTPGAGVYASLC